MNEFIGDNWNLLKPLVISGDVIPFIGPDALLVVPKDQIDSKPEPFYRKVAQELLNRFQVAPQAGILGHTWALHKAVDAILVNKKPKIQVIRGTISDLVKHYSEQVVLAESLQQLVGIKAFRMFVSLTPDDLLKNALADYNASEPILHSSCSLNSASELQTDLPPLSAWREGERGLFQMLSNCANNTLGFVAHEEDALEFLYALQTKDGIRYKNILNELRRKHLLFIGCNFPDWFGRALFRLVNDKRLGMERETQEFLCPCVADENLNFFLAQHSSSTFGFEGNLDEFVSKLSQCMGNYQAPSKPLTASRLGPTVFVSYASENAVAARCIADNLLSLGFSDVWLDKKKLKSGDDWSDRIEEAIKKCDFFLPLLSQEADSRREGVYWKEWRMALERAERISGAYLLPVCIDAEASSKGHYRRISDGDTAKFLDKHLIHAPNGILDTDACESLRTRCDRFREDADD